MLTLTEKNQLLHNYINNHFKILVDTNIYSTIFNCEHTLLICTNQSARSLGCQNWQELPKISLTRYNDVELAKFLFKEAYNEKTSQAIHEHSKRILKIQEFVLTYKKVVSFIDLLPYNYKFKSYLITYIPIYYSNGEIIGIQSFSIDSRFLSFQEHVNYFPTENPLKNYSSKISLTIREAEIMFLLANGVNQDQIAQILGVSRGTVGTIIANQLCVKFGIHGSNTKLLAQLAIKEGYYQYVPQSLWKPVIITLENELSEVFLEG